MYHHQLFLLFSLYINNNFWEKDAYNFIKKLNLFYLFNYENNFEIAYWFSIKNHGIYLENFDKFNLSETNYKVWMEKNSVYLNKNY